MTELEEIRREHDAYIQRCEDRGLPVGVMKAPCCGGEIKHRLATAVQVWDTMSICTHCGKQFMKITTATKVTGHMVD